MKERLALLLENNVISLLAYDGCLMAVTIIDNELNILHENVQYQMAITHLARAVDRIWQQQPIKDGLDHELLVEIQENEHYQSVLSLHRQVLNVFGITKLPQAEESFLIANIFALFQTQLETREL